MIKPTAKHYPIPCSKSVYNTQVVLNETNILIDHSPNGVFQGQKKQTTEQLAIYKCDRGSELGTTKNNSSQWSEQDLNTQLLDFKSGMLNSWSCGCFLISILSCHTSTTHCSCFLDCLREHTQCIMKRTICFIKDLLCGSPDYNGARFIKFAARKMQQLQQRK